MGEEADAVLERYEGRDYAMPYAGRARAPKHFMQNNDKTYTCAEVALLADESWVNGAVEAHALKIETIAKKAGGNFWKATLGDAPGDYTKSVSLSLFNAPRFSEGDRIRIGGGGIKKGSYQGKPQIGMGKSSTLEVMQVGSERIQAAMTRPSTPPADPTLTAPGIIHGATVGAALNQVFAALTRGLSPVEVREDLKTPEFWSTLEQGASDFIRLSRKLESGQIAPSVNDQPPM
jgi:hypothetical protein